MSGEEEGESDHSFIGFNAFAFVFITVMCLLIGYVIKRKQMKYLPDSVATLGFGFVFGGILSLSSEEESSAILFSPNLFFFVLIPPIIFEAGYTLRRKDFFRNIGAIILYAVPGTVISALTCGYILFAFASSGVVPLDPNSPLESLLFGTAISATDSVAILALLGSKELNADPMLYSLVFGESVLNDAVVIVLYNTFEAFLGKPISFAVMMGGVFSFFVTAIGSTVVGALVALFCCVLFKYVDFTLYPVYELTLTMCFAYISYFIAEAMHLSGIMSLFFCAVVLAHYNHYNISEESQISTHELFKSLAQISETFVFAYMGVQLGLALSPHAPPELAWNIPLVFVTLFSCAVSRFLNIYPLSIVVNNFRELPIPLRMQLPMWFSGLRGAVAFALAMKVPTENGSYIVTTTLAVVMTTLSFGGLTMPILKMTKLTNSDIQVKYDKTVTLEFLQKRKKPFFARLAAAWLTFDNAYMRRFFGGRHDPRRENLDLTHLSSQDVQNVVEAASSSSPVINNNDHSDGEEKNEEKKYESTTTTTIITTTSITSPLPQSETSDVSQTTTDKQQQQQQYEKDMIVQVGDRHDWAPLDISSEGKTMDPDSPPDQ